MLPLIAAGVAAAGGIIGKLLGDMDQGRAQDLINQAMDSTGKIDVPKLEGLTAQEVGPSAMESIKEDPRLRDAQYGVLERFRQMGDQGGMDLEDRANLNRVTSQTNRAAAAGRNQIQQTMDSRGMGGSGASLLMQMKGNQDQAQNASQAGMDMQGQAMRRRFDAMKQQGQMAGDLRGQDFSEASRTAAAKDEVARYNAGVRTAAGQYRNQMVQQNFNNTMGKQHEMNALAGGAASNASQQGQNNQNLWAGLGTAAGGAINAYGQQAQASDDKSSDRAWQEEENRKNRAAWSGRDPSYTGVV